MQSIGKDYSRTIEIDAGASICAVSFIEDGKEILSGGGDNRMLRRWRADDGHEVDKAIRAGPTIWAAAMSRNCKRLACGLNERVIVWDMDTHETVLDIQEDTSAAWTVDICSDASKFATGGSSCAYIRSMATGERLVGPLQHDSYVLAVRFSPSGDRIATATAHKSIRVYDSVGGQELLNIPLPFKQYTSSPLAWSADGSQLFAVALNQAKCFDSSSGSLLGAWSIPGDTHSAPSSIVPSCNKAFTVVVAHKSLSFWDAVTHTQIGSVIEHTGPVWSIALSPNDECIATGERNGKITLRHLRDILPDSCFPIPHTTPPSHQLPLTHIEDAVFKSWTQGDLTRAEQLLTEEVDHSPNPSRYACALAHRALIRSRSKHSNMAIDDAKQFIEAQRTVIGLIALAITHVQNKEYELALRAFDLVFTDGFSTENNFLLLIKAIILFQCEKCDDAISRINDLYNIVDDKTTYIIVWAKLFLLRGGILMERGDNDRSAVLLKCMREAIPIQRNPHLTLISLIFGMEFDNLEPAIEQHVEECIKLFRNMGDAAVQSQNLEEAAAQYSTALSMNPLSHTDLLVKRSKALAMLNLWEDALKDADQAIKADPQIPWGYERRYAALHGLHRFDEAVCTVSQMLPLMEESHDHTACELIKKYISPSRSEVVISDTIQDVVKTCPLVLIDVSSGYLCDGCERAQTFKSGPQFKELVSSMIFGLDSERILQVVKEYFRYVTFSHVWEGKEPSYQDVQSAGSVWNLGSSPLNIKLHTFCRVVHEDGYRWAWSDTCCIDKMASTILNQSLKMMYKWYEASSATFVFLADVDSLLATCSLKDSRWMTRAWTAQELLAPTLIRFYDRNWRPYLGDARANHKESPEIMQELVNATGITHRTITAFSPDSLSIREKLRLASTRKATVEEDVAYSLIGVFKSDIRPDYGEQYAALGHLLEEIVARSGEVTVLDWAGQSSLYNSCLPATLAVYNQTPHAPPAMDDAELNRRVSALRNSLSPTNAADIYDRITHLPPARFASRRLYLPSIVFTVKNLAEQGFRGGEEMCYSSRVSGIGCVEFQSSDRLAVTEPRKLIFVHPWIYELCDPPDGLPGGASDHESESEPEADSAPTSSLSAPAVKMDKYTRALRLVVRLQRPFHALLLQQQTKGEFRRVATKQEIVIRGLSPQISFTKKVRTDVVEIL